MTKVDNPRIHIENYLEQRKRIWFIKWKYTALQNFNLNEKRKENIDKLI
jgi:hypothetical protein